QRLRGGGVHLAAFDKPSANLVDVRDVLDPHRADIDIGHALHAGPDRLRPDRSAEDARVRVAQWLDVQLMPEPERTFGDLTQVEDQVARRERITGVRRRTSGVALAALRARVELDEVPRGEIEDRSVTDLVRLCVRRNRRQLLSGLVVAQRDARRAREQVHRLRKRNGGNEAERYDA